MNGNENPPARDSESVILAAVPSAVGIARLFVAHVLMRWEVGDLIDSARLLMSELVTNAVRATGFHGSRLSWSALYVSNVALVVPRVHLYDSFVMVSVWDRDPVQPAARESGAYDTDGRGLLIVTAMSTGWGSVPLRSGGKIVWATLPIPGRPPLRTPPDGDALRRAPGGVPADETPAPELTAANRSRINNADEKEARGVSYG